MIWLGCERYTFNKIEDGGTATLYNTDKLAHYILLDDKKVMVSEKDYNKLKEEL